MLAAQASLALLMTPPLPIPAPSPSLPVPLPSPEDGTVSACDLPGASMLCSGVGGLIQAAAGSVLDDIARTFQEAAKTTLGMMTTFWVQPPTPVLSGQSSPVLWIQASTQWYVAALAVLGLLLAAGRLAVQRRAEPALDAVGGMATLVVVTGCGTAVISLLVQGSDVYSAWIVTRALGDADFSGSLTGLMALGSMALGPGLIIILAIAAIISCVLQIMMMLARVAMLGLLAGMLPMAAAMSGTPQGRAWLSRMAGWTLAFILYKPVAATIYAYAFIAMGDVSSELSQLAGILMITLGVVALPALMRFLAPVTAAVTSGGGGSGAGMAGGVLATGARLLPMVATSTSSSTSTRTSTGPGSRSSGGPGGARVAPSSAAGAQAGGTAAKTAGTAAGASGAGATGAAAAASAGTAAVAVVAAQAAGAAQKAGARVAQAATTDATSGGGPDGAR